ncbi:MAG: NAD-dependent epimerase/dehydratase family protein, partial [Pyrinomonadaceae bacterium]
MAILVTGGAGYIGSITVELLQAQGASVVVLDNLSNGHRDAINSSIPFYLGDIGDAAIVERITREHKIEACIHFAALAYVGVSVVEPANYFQNNVVSGISLVDSLLKAGVHKIVFSSTCATYGEPKQIPIAEDHPQLPANPYGWSKLFMERIMEAYDRAYGLRYIALRYFNAAGASAGLGEH